MIGVVTVAARHTNTNSFTDPDTEPDRSRPGVEHLYPIGSGNRR